MNKLRVAVLFVALLLFSSLAGAQVLEVVLQGFGSAQHVLNEELIPEFEARHPGVKVEVLHRGWGGYLDYYISRHIGGMAPDVLTLGSEALGAFAEQGLLLNLDPYLATWDGYDDVVPPAWEGVQYNGSAYAMPFKLGVRTLTYRADLFEEAGLSGQIAPATWQELADFARRLAQKDGEGRLVRHGFTVQTDWKFVIPFLFQAGLDVWRDDNTTDLNSVAGVEAFEFLKRFVYQDESAALFGGNLMNSFNAGSTAMMWATSVVMDIAHGDSALPPEALGVALPPAGAVQTTQMHLDRFAISSQTKHPDLAWAWLEFLMEPENQSKLAMATKFLAPSLTTIQLPPFSDDVRWLTWLEAALISRPIPDTNPTWNSVLADVFQPAMNTIMRNEAPVPSALEEVERQVAARYGK